MSTLIVYDSIHGNTEMIAKAISEAGMGEVSLKKVGTVDPEDWSGLGLFIVGSPTHGGRPTPAVQSFLESIPEGVLKGVKVAAFDTRLSSKMVGVFGYAAVKAANKLQSKGGILAGPPEGFFVKGRTGPLKEGEPERAARWAKEIIR